MKELFDSQFFCSGDSLGRVVIWNKKSGVASKIFEESLSEIHAICCNKDTVFASGIDSKVFSFKLIKE